MSDEELIERAMDFALTAHSGQTRKYTGELYFNHCKEVADIVRSAGGDACMIAAAYLHDTVEDCGVSLGQIARIFGEDVSELVMWLSDISTPEDGNRRVRKAIDRAHIENATPRAKTIKLADLISNSRTIVKYDPDFAKVYLREKRELLVVLTEGDSNLWHQANNMVIDGFTQLGIV